MCLDSVDSKMKDVLVLLLVLFSLICLAYSLKIHKDQQEQIRLLNSNLEILKGDYEIWQGTVNSNLIELEKEENTYGIIDK